MLVNSARVIFWPLKTTRPASATGRKSNQKKDSKNKRVVPSFTNEQENSNKNLLKPYLKAR